MKKYTSHLKRNSLFTFTFLILFIFSYAHAEQNKSRLIIFGDSLVDVGNDPAITSLQEVNGHLVPGFVLPPPTRYDRGRFSNGPVIVDYLATRLGIFLKPSETGFDLNTDNVSYAYGGAQTGIENLTPGGFPVRGLSGQIDKFTTDLSSSNVRINKITFIIWVGANDYLNTSNPNYKSIVDNILQAVEDLSNLGAKRIIVINLPDLGKLPLCSTYNICGPLTALTNNHNQLLANHLDDIKKTQRSTKIILFDAHSIFDEFLANPTHFGFVNDLGAGPGRGCLFQSPSEFFFENCDIVNFTSKNIFWDEIHPSTRAHEILADKIWALVFQ